MQQSKMLDTSIPSLILKLSAPTVASMLVTVIYNTADTWFVSQINTSASAAVGVVFSIMSIIQAIGFGIGMGCGTIISRKLGEQKYDESNTYASSAFFASLLLGLVIALIGLAFLRPFLSFIGATKTILPYASDYAKYILIVAPFTCASFVLNNIFRAEGSPVLGMIGLCTGAVINLALDPIFIFVLNFGISGAAIATGISQIISFLILLSAFIRGKSVTKLSVKSISRDIKCYGLIIATGFPTVCRQGLGSVASAVLNIQAAFYGDAAVAAITIANKIYMFIRNIIVGVGQGFQPVAGFNYGAGRKDRTREAFKFTCVLGSAVCIVCAALTAVYSEQLVTWFRNDPDVVRIGSAALVFAAIVTPLMAYSTYVNQLYQCLGFKLAATFLASCRQGIFFLPVILILPHFVGITGIEAAQPLADLFTFIISVPFQIRFFKKHLSLNK